MLFPFSAAQVETRLAYHRDGLTVPLDGSLSSNSDALKVRADVAKRAQERLIPYRAHLATQDIGSNPLAVWGTAHIEGFFTPDELPRVGMMLSRQFELSKCILQQYAWLVVARDTLRSSPPGNGPHSLSEIALSLLKLVAETPLNHYQYAALNSVFHQIGVTLAPGDRNP